jgi:FkbM family methyltransferase
MPTIDVNGTKLKYPKGEGTWIYESDIPAYLRRVMIAPDQVWVDAGAHVGGFALAIAPRVSHVFAVEPDPENFALLTENIVTNCINNVTAIHAALTCGIRDEVEFFRGRKSWGHSMYVKRGRKKITVPAARLLDITPAGQFSVKMDIEGAELDVLQSVHNAGAWGRIDQLVMEYHIAQLRDAGHLTHYKALVTALRREFSYVRALEAPRSTRTANIFATRLV